MRNIVLLVSTLLTVSLAVCPSSCDCTAYTSDCTICLQAFYREWGDANCQCQHGFTEMIPPADKCRPTNCTTYNSDGCTSCASNQDLYFNATLNITVCVCSTNYYSVSGSCRCLAEMNPTSYYSVSLTCKVCPLNCQCSRSGCYQCESSTNRTIVVSHGLSICDCAYPYVEVQGSCNVYAGCSIRDGELTCSASSNRQELSGQWVCIYPYTDVHGVCQCQYPYILSHFIKNSSATQCACSSKLKPTLFFETIDSCLACPKGCTCTNIGCSSCLSTSNRKAGLNCPCNFPYVDYKGECICIYPYYLQTVNSTTICKCLNSLYPTQYYTDPRGTAGCYPCPKQCNCTTMGCVSCDPLRQTEVIITDAIYYTCSFCAGLAYMSDGECICPPNSIPSSNNCVCNISTTIYTNEYSDEKCVVCPSECNCTAELGCYQCQPSAHRQVYMQRGYYVCPCPASHTELQGKCSICVPPGKMDANGNCTCDQLKYEDCTCRSLFSPHSFYQNSETGACEYCPSGCNCSEVGCYSCSGDTLRYVITYLNKSICPCIQLAFEIAGICTYCMDGYHSVHGECVKCENCATCGVDGCLSCNSDMTLIKINDGWVCQCNNTNLLNINNTCACAIGSYFYQPFSICYSCPSYCRTCIWDSGIVCTSCRANRHRRNAVHNKCACQDGYRQASPAEQYCCSKKCLTCNVDGCLTCTHSAHRQLVGMQCVCIDTFVEINNTCVCPAGTILRFGLCLTCPAKCQQCHHLTLANTYNCTVCQTINRNISSEDCRCLQGYVEAPDERPFCVPRYCENFTQTGVCTTCIVSREVHMGICSCQKGSYDTGVNGKCNACNSTLQACLICLNSTQCTICNDGFILVRNSNSSICRQLIDSGNVIVSQSWKGISVLLKLTFEQSNYSLISAISAYLHDSSKTTTINVLSSVLLDSSLMQVVLANPDTHLTNQLLHLNYTFMRYANRQLGVFFGINQQGPFEALKSESYMSVERVCSASEVGLVPNSSSIVTSLLIALVIVAALVLYILGFKHNQILFYLQTLALLGYCIDSPDFSVPRFLHSMQLSHYQFGQRTSPLVPTSYMEPSTGNFAYFHTDSNLFRGAFSTLILTSINCLVIVVLRIAFQRKPISTVSQLKWMSNSSTKKIVYRLLQFFYKTCMYPLLFFSVVGLSNWNTPILIGQQFHNMSRYCCVVVVATYSSVTLWQWFGETAAKVNRIENAVEFLSAFVAAGILALTIGSDLYLLLIVVFCLKTIAFVWVRKVLLRDFSKVDYSKVATMALEVASLASIKTNSVILIVSIIVPTVLLQLAHQTMILVLTKRRSSLDKGSITEQVDDSSKMELEKDIDIVLD